MHTISLLFAALALILVSSGMPDAAPLPRQTSWEELAPEPDKPIEDPLAHLDPYIAAEIYLIASAVRQKDNGLLSEVSPEYETALETKYRLEKRGVEVDNILFRLEAVESEIRQLESTFVDKLDGQFVKIPGYALPLELDGVAVQEFLLVPYVGACIHVPPPPPNQIILVDYPEGLTKMKLFDPIWVSGEIKTVIVENFLATSAYSLRAHSYKKYI